MTAAAEVWPAAQDDRDPVARLRDVCDPGTVEDVVTVDGAAAGRGRLDGVGAHVFATDARVQGGALGRDACALVVATYELALAARQPVVGVWQSGGARLTEGARSLDAIGRIFAVMTRASGVVPQVSLVLGPSAGGAAYGPALTDVVVMGPSGRIFVTGPDVVRQVTGEDVDMTSLGGPSVHGGHSGVVHVVAPTQEEAFERTRRVTALLAGGRVRPVAVGEDPDPSAWLPESPRRAYDVRPIVDSLLDGPALELHPAWAPNMVTALGRLHGRTVGVLANNPLRLGGCLNATASDKAARFVRMCDSLGIPLVVLVDVPGYLPGASQELEGVVRRGAKLLHAFAAASVPRITVITRKAYGGAYIAMNSVSLGATRVLAWPDAAIDVMNAVAAVRILHRRTLAAMPEPVRGEAERVLAEEHAASTGGLAAAEADGSVHEVIPPPLTRPRIADILDDAVPARGVLRNTPL